MIRRKRGYLTPVVISVVCWLIFIWLRTFTYMANYNEGTGVYSFLLAVIITMIGTFFYWSLFKPEESEGLISLLFGDELEEYLEETPVGTAKKWSILRKSMFLVGCLAFLCLLAFAFEMWTDITVFTDSTYMDLGFFGINKNICSIRFYSLYSLCGRRQFSEAFANKDIVLKAFYQELCNC